MPNTYSQIYIQIVFVVKGRQNLIPNKGILLIQEKVMKYRPALINLGKDVNLVPQQEQFESELTKIRI